MKILTFAGSNSKNSINKKLVTYTCSLFQSKDVEILDLNDYELPLFGVDYENAHGVPQKALNFAAKIDESDLIIISFAEHNGAYSVAFKNIFDWLSRIPNRKAWGGKSMFLMATSPGARGGSSVLEIAKARFPFNGGTVLDTFSLPNFNDNFSTKITNDILNQELIEKVKRIESQF